jgi:SAM-dependent methyltransferase
MTAFADHFSSRAADYAAYRPSYPPALIEHLSSLCTANECAWDAGTGNGQAAVLLAEQFAHVIATDASEEQLKRARTHPRVVYKVAQEDGSGLANTSTDLVTVAQALHWFDRARFYAEVQRVLKPRGVFAAWCYDLPRVDAAVDPVVGHFYHDRTGPFWPPERRHVDAMYRDLEFPFDEIPHPAWSMAARLNREQFLGYVRSWSAVTRARETTGAELAVELQERLEPVWSGRPDDVRTVAWPIGLRVGRTPSR